jgi:diguanylate cyclase (GGDEF)-like protein
MTYRTIFSGLAGRILGLFLALMLAVQSLGFLSIRHSIEANARLLLQDELKVGERVLHRLLAQSAQQLQQGAALLAADYGFREAVNSEDSATIQDALSNQSGRIGATVAAWLGPDLQLRAVSGGDGALRQALGQLPRQADGSPQLSQWLLVDQQAYQVVTVPMKAPLLVGWVVMGFPLTDAAPKDLHGLSDLHMAWLKISPSQTRVVASSQAGLAAASLAQWPLGAGQGQVGDVAVQTHAVSWLSTQEGELRAVLWRSVDAAVAPYRRLQWLLLGITLLGLGVLVAGSVWTARRVTRPLQALVDASRRLGQGDFKTPIALPRADDEVTELAQAFEQMRGNVDARNDAIRNLAFTDSLTGLPNRARFSEALRDALDEGGLPAAVLLLNLDRLQQVNNNLGYDSGNQVLVQVAERLQRVAAPRGGLVARFSADDFALLLPHAGVAEAEQAAAEIHEALVPPLLLNEHPVDVSAGIGLAAYPAHGETPAVLLSHAEMAMHAAKQRKLGSLVYSPELNASSAQTLSLLGELRRAVREGELRLFVQPKLAVGSGRILGGEALVRWQHPQRGMVPPLQFIPFAEDTGFIHTLTLWVVEEATRIVAAWRAQGFEGRLSINLSTHDLAKPDLLAQLDARLATAGVPPNALCLEITESAIMSDPQRAVQTLHALQARGYKLSIDDFGTGYSSYATLKTLPVHELKIDMSFVRAMEREPKDAMIVRSIVELGHNLGLSVVAEGVENATVLERLHAMGCDEAQGWHIGKPMPAAEFDTWLQQRQAAATPA